MNPRTRLVSASATSPRWNQWAEKGRRENAAYKEKVRVIAAIAGLAIGFALSIWGLVSFLSA